MSSESTHEAKPKTPAGLPHTTVVNYERKTREDVAKMISKRSGRYLIEEEIDKRGNCGTYYTIYSEKPCFLYVHRSSDVATLT